MDLRIRTGFGVFRRLQTNSTDPGTGIGVAIVKKAVTLLGGTLRLESTLGAGSSFTMILPKAPPEWNPGLVGRL